MQSLEPLSYFFGAFLGDGCANINGPTYRVIVGCCDEEIIQRCYSDITCYFNDLRRGRFYKKRLRSGKIYCEVVWNSEEFYDLIRVAVGDKEWIPDYIWNASKTAQLEFMSGLMDTDGTIATNNRGSYQVKFAGGCSFVRCIPPLCELLGMRISSVYRATNSARCYSFTFAKDSLRQSGFKFYCGRKQERLDLWMSGGYNALYSESS